MFRNAINFLKANTFLKDRRGSVAPIFALSLIPTVGMIGAAVDYSRANNIRAAMQSALDSTTLAMAGSAPTVSEEKLKTDAKAFFESLFKKPGTTGVNVTTEYTNTNGSQLVMTADTSVPTEFLNIPGLGIQFIPIKAQSTTTWGNTRLRVALALDNTGSMSSNNKMTALKTAAKGLIDQLKTAATNDGDVYVSIVPFAKDVNVGAANKDAAWLDWADWETKNGSCSKNGYTTKSTCVAAGKKWTVANHNTWTGCVTDRNQPYDTTNAAPSDANGGVTRFPAEQYANCPAAITPLSYDWATLKTKIDAMQPTGNTNTTIGLEWGWHSLTKNAPMNAPAEDEKYTYKKFIIFLTDGDNTQNRWTSNQSQIDARMSAACTNAKNEGVIVYTILVMQGSENLLKNCASSPSMYFKITQSNQLVTVFNQIGTQMSRLRVAK
jgi:uncharacterized protein YegL